MVYTWYIPTIYLVGVPDDSSLRWQDSRARWASDKVRVMPVQDHWGPVSVYEVDPWLVHRYLLNGHKRSRLRPVRVTVEHSGSSSSLRTLACLQCVLDSDNIQRLSVLKSHFNLTCRFVLNSCIVFCERRFVRIFVRTFDLQKGFSLSEAVNDGSGKEMVWVPKI